MDISSLLSTLTDSESLTGLAQAANVDSDSARSILSSALPSLLSGAMNQSQNSETAEGFAAALTQHASSDTSSISSFLSNVDLADGGKILSHLLGTNTDSTLSQIAQSTGTSTEATSGVLSAAAPLLMSLLGQQTGSAQASGTGIADIMTSLMGGSDMSSLLSGLLGGAGSSGLADTLTEVTNAAGGSASASSGKTGLLGILGKLFGK